MNAHCNIWLLQCWLRWPPGRHDWTRLSDCRVCSRCGVLRKINGSVGGTQ